MVLKCWLADQHNLEWERAGCKRVCQLPHLLEGLEGQVLRLINDESHIPAPDAPPSRGAACIWVCKEPPDHPLATGTAKRRAR